MSGVKTQVLSANKGFFRNELTAGSVNYPASSGNVGEVLIWGPSGNLEFGQPEGVTPEAFGAVGDGITDDTVAVQAAIDAAVGAVKFEQTYLHGPIRIRGGLTYYGGGTFLALDGLTNSIDTTLFYGENQNNDNTTNQLPANYPTVAIENIIFSDLHFTATDVDYFVFMFHRVNNICWDKCTFNFPTADFTTIRQYAIKIVGEVDTSGAALPAGPGPNYFDMPVADSYSNNVRITNCNFTTSDIEFFGVRGGVVSNNFFLDCGYPIRVDAYNLDVLVTNNYTRNDNPALHTFIPAGTDFGDGGVYVGQGNERVVVNNNIFVNFRNYGVVVESAKDVTVTGNVIFHDQTTAGAIGVFIFPAGVFGIKLGVSDINVSGNVMEGVFQGVNSGLNSVNDLVRGLTVSSNMFRLIDIANSTGIIALQCQESVFNSNTIYNCTICVLLDACFELHAANNICRGQASAIGFFIRNAPSDNITLERNDIDFVSGGTYIRMDDSPTSSKLCCEFGKTNAATLIDYTNGTASSDDVIGNLHTGDEFLINTSTVSDPTASISFLDSTAGAISVTLAAGSFLGHIKTFIHTSGSNSSTITPSSLVGGSTIITRSVGESVRLMWTGFQWALLGINNLTDLLTDNESVTAAGPLSLTTHVSFISTSVGDYTVTLADGVTGQRKVILYISGTDKITVTPTNLFGGTSVFFRNVGDIAELVWTGSSWSVVSKSSVDVFFDEVDVVASAGAISLTTHQTFIQTSGLDYTATLAAGAFGQRKTIIHIGTVNTVTISATIFGGANIFLDHAGDSVDLLWTGTSWAVVSRTNTGDTHASTELVAATGSPALSVTAEISNLQPSAAQAGITLPDGRYPGQRKTICHAIGAFAATVTPATFASGTSVTTNAVGESYVLVWNGSSWFLESMGSSAGATGPVVA